MLIDTHNHMDRCPKDQLAEVIAEARSARVERFIAVGGPSREGGEISTSRAVVELAESQPEAYAAVGVHPWSVKGPLEKAVFDQMRELAKKKKVVAIGEIGLDFTRDNPKDAQMQVFREHIRLARELKLPMSIHVNAADAEAVQILKEEKGGEVGGVMHGFRGDAATARQCVEMGFLIGVGRALVSDAPGNLPQVVREMPLETLVLETDSAGLPPPTGGPRLGPALTRAVAEKVAEIKGVSLQEVERVTTQNVERAFRLST